jgi:hypothetical protein
MTFGASDAPPGGRFRPAPSAKLRRTASGAATDRKRRRRPPVYGSVDGDLRAITTLRVTIRERKNRRSAKAKCQPAVDVTRTSRDRSRVTREDDSIGLLTVFRPQSPQDLRLCLALEMPQEK